MSAQERSFEVVDEPGVRMIGWAITVREDSSTPATTPHLAADLVEVEQFIDRIAAAHTEPIARTVHTLGGRDLYPRGGSRVEIRWEPVITDWRCADCGVNTDAIDEYYMVLDELWAQADVAREAHLCIGCLEFRLGRTLTSADFTSAAVNSSERLARSARLRDRMEHS